MWKITVFFCLKKIFTLEIFYIVTYKQNNFRRKNTWIFIIHKSYLIKGTVKEKLKGLKDET